MNLKNFVIKNFLQIKKGGVNIFLKKIISLSYLIFQFPMYLISIPIFIIITLISPWYLIRFKKIWSSRIGHFVLETELYCCERDANINFPKQKYKDFFYLDRYVSNKALEIMWRRSILILPSFLIKPVHKISILFYSITRLNNIHDINSPFNHDRDVYNLQENYNTHINFTSEQEIKGENFLKEFGIPKNSKFICLIVRDSGYLNRKNVEVDLKRWIYHSYRDGDIDNYVLAAEELASRGYYVFRMGVNVLKPLKSSNPKIIDYANSEMRSDFMDIYLGAKCFFLITTGCGFDAIPSIFKRPIALTHVPLGLSQFTSTDKCLLLTKHHKNKLTKKELTISEIFSSNVGIASKTEEFEKNNVELLENTSEELRDFVIEMDDRLTGKWKETSDDIFLQKKFWSIFEKNMNNLDPNRELFKKGDHKFNLHGKIKAKFSAKYLRDNKNWIN